ncbi:response regulator [Pedosphaera parvula]|nr:response regulator [Pedosphaera parvula]
MKSILLIDDSEDDVFFMKQAIDTGQFPCNVTVLRQGEDAIQYLATAAEQVSLPDIIILDVKMPGMDGHEVLNWIRTRPKFRHIPVVMLTISNFDRDKDRAYHLGANSYLVKPRKSEELNAMVQLLSKYWLGFNHTLAWT